MGWAAGVCILCCIVVKYILYIFCLWKWECHSCDALCFQCSFWNRKYFVISANLWPKYGTNTETFTQMKCEIEKIEFICGLTWTRKQTSLFNQIHSYTTPTKHVRSVYSIWLRLVHLYRKHIFVVVYLPEK